MGKITAWRSDDPSTMSEFAKEIAERKQKRLEKFGRNDITRAVEMRINEHARINKLPPKESLELLIKEHGSYENFQIDSEKKYKKIKYRSNKNRSKYESDKKPKSAYPNQSQMLINHFNKSTRISIVLGGAPGLGKKKS